MSVPTEQELNQKANAPRVQRIDIEKRIVSTEFHVINTTTICVITLDNGFSTIGEAACVFPENFDPSIGRRISEENAFDKLWPLFGFMLAEKRHKGEV